MSLPAALTLGGRGRALAVLADCLRLPGADGGESKSADLRRIDDWRPVIGLANEHLIATALPARLAAGGRLAQLPAEVRGYLEMLVSLNRQRNRALKRQVEEIVAALNDKGLTPILLKGARHLFGPAPAHFGRAARMMRDLDILIAPEGRAAAAAALGGLGYRALTLYPRDHNAVGDFGRPGAPGAVDLHVELTDARHLLSAAEVRAAAVALPCRTGEVLGPSPTHRLLHHLLHAQIHFHGDFYRAELGLNQVYELAALAADLGARVDWAEIEGRLAAQHLTPALEAYVLAAGRLFGLPWPLARPPSRTARLHLGRCLFSLAHPRLHRLLLPVGNLHGLFAWHRMRALYGEGAPAAWRLRHGWQALGKLTLRQMLERLTRFQ